MQHIAQTCYDQVEPAEMPGDSHPVERLLDSAAIAALSRLPPPPDTARRARAFYIHFDSAGRPDTVRAAFPLLVDSTFAARVRDALQPALRVGPPYQPFNVTVVVNTGPDASLTPRVFVGRQARLANQTRVSNQLHRSMRQLRQRDTLLFGRQFTVHVKMIANLDSTATSASVVRSSGVPAVDSVALNVASAVRFSPGELEGIPVPEWVELPLILVFPQETAAERRRRLRRQATSSSPPH
ncbi:MAG TPA: energy transducer TonB [Longimicrobium sp.]